VCALTQLRSLNLAGNALTELPEAFSGLTELHTLFFLGNAFSSIPLLLGRLPKLFMLSFKSCRLQAVHASSLAPSLGWLILTDNQLQELPPALGQLRCLRKLMLASNRLQALPDMSGLQALELVRLSDNRLRQLPLSLLQLPRLAWLALGGNELPPLSRGQAQALLLSGAGSSSSSSKRRQLQHFQLLQLLGEGASGRVYAARERGEEEEEEEAAQQQQSAPAATVAVKVFKEASSDGRPLDELAACLALSAQPAHENLLSLSAYVAELAPVPAPAAEATPAEAAPAAEAAAGPFSQLAAVLELCRGMRGLGRPPSFASVTRDCYPAGCAPPALNLLQAAHIGRAVASAAAHLHRAGLAHGDIYAHNVLLGEELWGGEEKEGQQQQQQQQAQAQAQEGGRAQREPSPLASSLRVKLCDLGAAFFYDRAATVEAALLQRIELRGWAVLLQELLALWQQGPGSSASSSGAPASSHSHSSSSGHCALAAALSALADSCLAVPHSQEQGAPSSSSSLPAAPASFEQALSAVDSALAAAASSCACAHCSASA
jgi:hypothetical protein